jgi:5-oxoprolinase (ATP-hydrolysing)
MRFPVRLEMFTIRHGSGGNGRWRGGNGVIRRLRFLEPATVTTLCSHRIVPPIGLAGGEPGRVGINRVERASGGSVPQAGNDRCEMDAGDVYHMETPGGGGFGKPN